MLSLNLSKIRTAATSGSSRSTSPDSCACGRGRFPDRRRRCRWRSTSSRTRTQFRLVGDVQTTLELPCSRCLEPFTWPVDATFDLRYQPHAANTGEGEREIEEDDLTTAFYENDEIDLGQLMREQFYLSLPMKPLCRRRLPGAVRRRAART